MNSLTYRLVVAVLYKLKSFAQRVPSVRQKCEVLSRLSHILEVKTVPVVKIVELIGSSPESWEEAVENAVKRRRRQSRTLKGPT